jgi:hypothetical protein
MATGHITKEVVSTISDGYGLEVLHGGGLN